MFDLTPWASVMPAAPGLLFASLERAPDLLRHWDGRAWSEPVRADDGAPLPDASSPRDPLLPAGVPLWWRQPTPEALAWLEAEGAVWPCAAA